MGLRDITTAIAELGDPETWRHTDTDITELLPALSSTVWKPPESPSSTK